MKRTSAVRVYKMVLALALGGCASLPQQSSLPSAAEIPAGPIARHAEKQAPRAAGSPATPAPSAPQAELYPGSGSFIDGAGASRDGSGGPGEGRYTLNFRGAELREVVKAILGDLLNENHTIDERVKGKVTIETRRPLTREQLVPTLEALLRANGAALVRTGQLYQVVPQGAGSASPIGAQAGLQRGRGYQHVIVPLRFIAAREVEKILKGLQGPGSTVQADPRRNLVILSGTEAELAHMIATVEMFDVDQLQGMSVGLFRVTAADLKTLQRELEELFGGEGGEAGGMLRLVPIERMNALLAITPQPKYLERVQEWIRRLDRTDAGANAGLHVYYVQNSRATHLAEVLAPLFGAEAARREALPPARLAPGARPSLLRSEPVAGAPRAMAGQPVPGASPAPGALAQGSASQAPAETRPVALSVPGTAGGARPGAGELDVGPVTIIADDKRNALIVKATAPDYAKIEQVIRKLDIWPLQVLVEATIVDVELSDELSLGVEWFLKGRLNGRRAESRLDFGAPGLAPLTPGFSFTVLDSTNAVRAVLNLLAAQSKLKVVSSPTMMVLDNHKASIRVGDQVPVRTSEAAGLGTSATSPIIASTFEYRDTGVLLEVTPRVNASGMVLLEIHQEVNDVQPTTTSGIDSPTINQRRINTTVAVQDGESIVLGGLMRDRKSASEQGIPGVSQVPVFGWLFKNKTDVAERSELIVILTPTAVRDQNEARAVTEELRRRMSEITLPDWLGRGAVPDRAAPPEPAR